MTALNFTVMQDKVEDGSKCRTYRLAKCVNVECEGMWNEMNNILKPKCYFVCDTYEYRIKVGGKLQLYTGLRQRKYCKNPPHFKFQDTGGYPCKFYNENNQECNNERDCDRKGAKLLRTATCVNTYPIKFEDLTEEDAVLDGFGHSGPMRVKGTVALWELKNFLIKAYDAKPDTVFQAIIWED